MKAFASIIAAGALLAAPSAAFAPVVGGSPSSSRLSMAAAETAADAPMPNPAIKLAANGMSLLKPIFAAEANLQVCRDAASRCRRQFGVLQMAKRRNAQHLD